jgi:hypothetical protein
MAKEITLAEKLNKVTALIKEISINPIKKVAVVSVELTYDKTVWHKPFAVTLANGKIKLADFKAKLQEEVQKDFDQDTALSELKAVEGKAFNLFEKSKTD